MTKAPFFLAALAAAPACSSLECGEGTIEMDGACITADEIATECAEHTTFDPATGRCEVNEDFFTCGAGTAREVDEVTGEITCTGSGQVDPCNPACPTPAGGRVTVCGRIYDIETTQPVGTAAAPFSGLTVDIYEPFVLVDANVPDPTPLEADVTVTECGAFVATGIPAQPTNLLAVGIEDAEGETDEYVLTGVAFDAPTGTRVQNVVAFATRRTTDALWTTEAGNPFGGDTFSRRGVFVPIFVDTTQPAVAPFTGTPAVGVLVVPPGGPRPANDHYFADATATSRTDLDDGLTVTGPNGSALLVESTNLDVHAGTGGEPATCTWEDRQAATVPDTVFVQIRHAVCPD